MRTGKSLTFQFSLITNAAAAVAAALAVLALDAQFPQLTGVNRVARAPSKCQCEKVKLKILESKFLQVYGGCDGLSVSDASIFCGKQPHETMSCRHTGFLSACPPASRKLILLGHRWCTWIGWKPSIFICKVLKDNPHIARLHMAEVKMEKLCLVHGHVCAVKLQRNWKTP